MAAIFKQQLAWRDSNDSRFTLGKALSNQKSVISQIGDAKAASHDAMVEFDDKMMAEWVRRNGEDLGPVQQVEEEERMMKKVINWPKGTRFDINREEREAILVAMFQAHDAKF